MKTRLNVLINHLRKTSNAFHSSAFSDRNVVSGEDKGRARRAQHDQFFYLKLFFSMPIMDEKMPFL